MQVQRRRCLAMRKLSVCPSVKRVDCEKTEERSVQIFAPYERPFSPILLEEEWSVGATPST